MQDRISFDLYGVQHNLAAGDIVCCIDHGGTGGDGVIGPFVPSSNRVEVAHREKFGAEVPPAQVLDGLIDKSHLNPTRVIYGVAAAVKKNYSRASDNMRFDVDGNKLRRGLPSNTRLRLRNDYGLVTERLAQPVDRRQTFVLQQGQRRGRINVITAAGAGSGLGTGRLLLLERGGHYVDEIEGSHGRLVVRCNPKAAINQLELLPWWQEHFGPSPANSDRVLCAGGLLKLLNFVVETGGYTLPTDLERLVKEESDTNAHQARLLLTQYAMASSNDDDVCAATIVLFMDLFGGFLQNAAFLHGPKEDNYRIYLLGGVLTGWLKEEQFWPRFGKYLLRSFCSTVEPVDERWLASVPIDIVKEHRLFALHGATIAAACLAA